MHTSKIKDTNIVYMEYVCDLVEIYMYLLVTDHKLHQVFRLQIFNYSFGRSESIGVLCDILNFTDVKQILISVNNNNILHTLLLWFD